MSFNVKRPTLEILYILYTQERECGNISMGNFRYRGFRVVSENVLKEKKLQIILKW